jgi:hypothetical protein
VAARVGDMLRRGSIRSLTACSAITVCSLLAGSSLPHADGLDTPIGGDSRGALDLARVAGTEVYPTLITRGHLAGGRGYVYGSALRARPWYWPLRGHWSITALVDTDDHVGSFSVQYHSGR